MLLMLRKLVTSVAPSRPHSRRLPFRLAGCCVVAPSRPHSRRLPFRLAGCCGSCRHGQRLSAENHLFGKLSELRKLLLRARELHFEWRLAPMCQL